MRSKFDGVLLASGGLDSTVLAYDLLSEGKSIVPLFLRYGQHCGGCAPITGDAKQPSLAISCTASGSSSPRIP